MTVTDKTMEKFNIHADKYKFVDAFIETNNITNVSAIPRSIVNVLMSDPNFEDLVERYSLIKTFGRDSTTLPAYLARYGDVVGVEKYKKRKQDLSYTSSKKYQSDKFGDDEYTKKRRSIGKDIMIERHGKEVGTAMWEDYLKRWKKSNSLEGRKEKFGDVEGESKHNAITIKFKHINSLKGYIERHGEEIGTRKWNNKLKQISYKNSKEYYIVKYGEDYKDILRRVKDSLSLTAHIERHGIEKGTRLYKERCAKCSEYAKEHKSVLHFKPENFYSKISQRFFKDLHLLLGDVHCMYGENNGEYFIYDKENKQLFFYDFAYNNKIIEFHGDYWHKNPLLYEPDENVIANDLHKKNLLLERGKQLLVIWEYDYYKEPEKTLLTALNYLTNEDN
jgi:hypothetical protein